MKICEFLQRHLAIMEQRYVVNRCGRGIKIVIAAFVPETEQIQSFIGEGRIVEGYTRAPFEKLIGIFEQWHVVT